MSEFKLTTLGAQHVELVNGAYDLAPATTLCVLGRQIAYAEGHASLDNSCCGELVVSFVLVYGELIDEVTHTDDTWRICSLDDAALSCAVRVELNRRLGGITINFYQIAQDGLTRA